jgi:hypothetical protein
MSAKPMSPTVMPHLPARPEAGGDEQFSRPDWLYRSEAFAEDLAADAPLAVAAAQPGRQGRELGSQSLSSGALYLATLVLAIASSVPSALLVA